MTMHSSECQSNETTFKIIRIMMLTIYTISVASVLLLVDVVVVIL